MKRALAILLCLIAFPVQASDVARELLASGQYQEARETALAAGTIDGLNLAAEAMAAEIMLMRVDNPRIHAKDAINLAEEALKRDPDNVEALFMRALHTGFRTRSSSAFAIMTRGLIGKTRRAIDDFEAASPPDGRADALRGAWHLGIVRAAGDGRFGASMTDGMAYYDAAIEARPDDLVIISNYAFSLIVMGDEGLLPRAKELLSRIASSEPSDATEAETRKHMMRLLDVLDQPSTLYERANGLLNTEETGS